MDKESPLKIYGVLGFPAKHSLSPLMHNAAYQALKINAEYKIFEKVPRDLEDFMHSLSKQNICGLNVTVPYKEKVIPFLDEIAPAAQLIGAVNTIKVSPEKIEGFNTDGEGLLKHLREDLGFDPKDKIIAIIGAGGAAKAVSFSLSKAGPKAITIYDIDNSKAGVLVNNLRQNFNNIDFNLADSIEGLNTKASHILINATPIGMKETDPPIIDNKFLHSGLLVYDLIYNPKETRLLSQARQIGARVSNGLGMLLYQGALSFEYFMGRQAPIEVMREALNKGAGKL